LLLASLLYLGSGGRIVAHCSGVVHIACSTISWIVGLFKKKKYFSGKKYILVEIHSGLIFNFIIFYNNYRHTYPHTHALVDVSFCTHTHTQNVQTIHTSPNFPSNFGNELIEVKSELHFAGQNKKSQT
jgi:hypothetical protein